MPRGKNRKEEEKTSRLAINAAATLQLVGADSALVERVANEILDRRLTDDSSGGTADTLIGEAVIETLTGQPAPAFLPRAGEVARALIDAQATCSWWASTTPTKPGNSPTGSCGRVCGERGPRRRCGRWWARW
ncbi:MAG: hypothetical protein ACKO5F_03875 [Synechococcus sp.]